ncbi:MAG TPA: serine/threonine-protein kinase, partial [Pyrinomonadaceae bacterium]|nr:serine/threonine-protein kinase [Pyrinomonadaceae bacterium]
QPGAQASSPVNEVVGYQVQKKLGQGGMGAVYLARRGADNLTVALKVMLSKVAVDEYARRLFSREIDVTASLDHPKIVRLYEHGAVGSAFYFALEYCPGGSVYDAMKERRRALPLAEAGRIILDVLDGLIFAHERGYIHRDIKPQNILLTSAEGGAAKLSDFGLAKSFQKAGLSGMTATSAVAGTFAFMPREQLTNFKYAKPVSDVWSTGATLYYMLTGQFTRDFAAAKDQARVVMGGRIVPLEERDPSIPPKIAAVTNRAIADDPRDRYQSAAELHSDLSAALPPSG